MKAYRALKLWAGCVLVSLLAVNTVASTVLYETGFEPAEGFNPNSDLAGQRSWMMEGTGGNGLISGFIAGFGQHAYIGYTPPTDTNDFTLVWYPVNYTPVPAGANIVRFSVALQFAPSTVGDSDDFRWSIYNAENKFLFSIDFETRSGAISYILDDRQFYDTGWAFSFSGDYQLDVWMNFARNLWTATLNGTVLANAQPITTTNAQPTFGRAAAVWSIRDPAAPGDNIMVFDEYIVVAESLSSIPPTLEAVGRSPEGFFQTYIHGEPGLDYSVDVTSNFAEWSSLGNFRAPASGTFLFEDNTSSGYPYSFYAVGPPVSE